MTADYKTDKELIEEYSKAVARLATVPKHSGKVGECAQDVADLHEELQTRLSDRWMLVFDAWNQWAHEYTDEGLALRKVSNNDPVLKQMEEYLRGAGIIDEHGQWTKKSVEDA